MTTCSICNITVTEKWYFRKTSTITKCKKCYDHIRHSVYSKKRITFIDKRIHLNENPRTGVCKLCGKKIGDKYIDHNGHEKTIKRTGMHHIKYHEKNPTKHTIEACNPCHTKQGWKLKQYDNKIITSRDQKTGRFISKRHN